MVEPKNLKPRFFMSFDMASDSGDVTGISAIVLGWLTLGKSP